jgi:SAM-dependent methyltransferase
VDVVVGDAEDPPVGPATVDVVTAGMMLFCLPDPDRAVAAWVRAARPGGRVAVSMATGEDPRWTDLTAAVAGLAHRHGYPLRLVHRPGGAAGGADEDALAGLLRRHGLRDLRSTVEPAVLRFAGPEEWWAWTWSNGHRAVWESLPPPLRERARRVALTHLDRIADPAGQVTMRVPVCYVVGSRPARR